MLEKYHEIFWILIDSLYQGTEAILYQAWEIFIHLSIPNYKKNQQHMNLCH